MSKIVVLGYGGVGRALVRRLTDAGRDVVVAQRSEPRTLPPGASFTRVDLTRGDSVKAACAQADTVVSTVGLPYRPNVWAQDWPIYMRHMIQAVEACGARFVFADNLYMYGPQTEPLREDMTMRGMGEKPAIRAQITREWMKAHEDERIRAVAVRASNFYGPDAPNSMLSHYGIKFILMDEAAVLPTPVDFPHDYTYVPDFARALESLIGAPDEDYGQAWHVPNAPTQTTRALLECAGELAGKDAKVEVMSGLLRLMGPMMSPALRALSEMKFQTDRPYLVDHSKFAARFWDDPTPFDDGLAATIAQLRLDIAEEKAGA